MERNLFAFVDAEGHNVFINPDQIRYVAFSGDSCEIWFSETHRINLNGPGAIAFIQRLSDRSIALNGEPIILPTLKSESSS